MSSPVITIYKTVSEMIPWTQSFAHDLSGDTALASITVTGVECRSTKISATGSEVAVTGILSATAKSGMNITFNMYGGTDGEEYIVRVVAKGTTTAAFKEKIIRLVIRDQIPGGL